MGWILHNVDDSTPTELSYSYNDLAIYNFSTLEDLVGSVDELAKDIKDFAKQKANREWIK